MADASDTGTVKAAGVGIAGGAIAVALLETLLDKQVLTLAEAQNVLERSMATAGLHSRIRQAKQRRSQRE